MCLCTHLCVEERLRVSVYTQHLFMSTSAPCPPKRPPYRGTQARTPNPEPRTPNKPSPRTQTTPNPKPRNLNEHQRVERLDLGWSEMLLIALLRLEARERRADRIAPTWHAAVSALYRYPINPTSLYRYPINPTPYTSGPTSYTPHPET